MSKENRQKKHEGSGVSLFVRLPVLVAVILAVTLTIVSVVSLPLILVLLAWIGLFDVFGGAWPSFTFPGIFSGMSEWKIFDWRGAYMPNPPEWMWVADWTLNLMLPALLFVTVVNLLTPPSIRINSVSGVWATKITGDDNFQSYIDELSKKYRGPRARLWVMPFSGVNAFAIYCGPFNRQAIVITSGMLTDMEPGLVKWIIAHEYGHILHGDTVNSSFWLLSMRSVRLFSRVRVFFARLALRVMSETPVMRVLVVPVIMFFRFLLLCGRIGSNVGRVFFLIVDRWASRKMEYAADRFATIEVGPSEGVYLFQNMKGGFEPLFNNLFATHPTFSNRIKEIVKYSKTDIKRKRIDLKK